MNKDDSAFKNEFSLNNVTSWEQIKRTEKVFWICSQGHDYEQSLFNRLKGYKCPYCAGKKILVGFNDLASTHPKVADEWHPTLNTEFTIHTISKGSTKKVWWLGSVCGHSWLMSPNSRTASKQGCAVCSGSQIIESKSVLSTHPELIKEWSDKNDTSLDSVSFGSKKKFIWLCPVHGEYIASVQTKTKGHGCYRCGKIATGLYRRTPDIKNSVGSLFPELYDLLDTSFHDVNELEKYKAGSNFVLHWVCVKGHKYESAIHTQVSALKAVTKGCGKCWVPSTSSTMEKELADFLVQLSVDNNFNIIAKDRKILEGKELDFYIPEKNIAIEFNGLYWHSEANGKGKYYHYDKWKKCKDKGIQLIQVWEDDWVSKSVFVKRMLSRKLNVSSDSKVFARKTYVKSLIADDVEDFLNDNHIQGFVSGSYYLGLVDKVSDRLIAVLVLKKEFVSSGVVLHIVRYATSVNVVGGFTKLLKYAELEYKPLSFVTFADNCVSDGGLYENNGFVVDKELKPDYMYVVKKERKHKFGFRLKKFRNDESLIYVDGLTEKELSLLNNMSRIWDAGKVRYVKMVSS